MSGIKRLWRKWQREGRMLTDLAQTKEGLIQARIDYIDENEPYLIGTFRYEFMVLKISLNRLRQEIIKTFYGL